MGHTLLKRLAATFALVVPGLAFGQADNRVKPELMLLIDSSGSMSRLEGQGAGFPACSPPDAAEPSRDIDYGRSRMAITQDVLTGTSRFTYWCVEHDRDYREENHSLGSSGGTPHTRPMCCARVGNDNSCSTWAPCGNDHGDDDADDDATALGVGAALTDDGLIARELSRIKFGMMTFDSNPSDDDPADPNDYSYGDEVMDVPQDVADGVGEGSNRGVSGAARGETRPNLGARSEEAPFGGLVPSNKGLIDNNGNIQSNAEINETPDRVRAHNRFVMDRVRRIVPYGGTPISPLLHDAKLYFESELAADGDPGRECRKRFAVLITDGQPTRFYGGNNCLVDADCEVPGEDVHGECVQSFTRARRDRCPCEPGEQCVGGFCESLVSVCEFNEGYPYSPSETYAAELFDMNIPVYVIGFNVDALAEAKARSIAEAGSPNLGIEDGDPGFFLASDEDALREALRRISNAALAGIQTRAKPLVVTPSTGDETGDRDVKQWRFFTYSEVPGAEDDARYGRLESTELGCPEDAPNARRIDELGRIRFDEELAGRNTTRRAVTRDPNSDENVPVVGGNNPMFNGDGSRGGRMNDAQARDFADAPAGEANGDDPLRVVGLLVNGFFGERGLPEGVDGDRGERQMGEVLEGDVVAIQPPALGIQSPSYTAFVQKLQNRPTMVATGARDGMIHFFRAQDGYEVFSLVPRMAWTELRTARYPADGPLTVADIAECRTIGGEGDEECPGELSEVNFRNLLAGGVGQAGANIFTVDLTNLDELSQPDQDGDLMDDDVFNDDANFREYIWDVTDNAVNDSTHQEAKLGRSVSRPVITHVRQGDTVRAAVVVGCGDDPVEASADVDDADGTGRCVLVLDAVSGALIKRIETPAMTRPMVGSPAAYPAGGITPAERVYIGDRAGRLWRIDLRDADPDDWGAEVAWPPADAEAALGYETGRNIIDRPSIALQEDGKLAVTFVNGNEGPGDASFAVSFDDNVTFAVDGSVSYSVEGNWVMPMLPDEYATGAPIIRDSVMYFTTVQPTSDDVCVTAQGRLYAIHFTDTLVDENGDPDTFTRADPRADSNVVLELNVLPQLPLFNEDGTRSGDNALALLLPPGRVAHGLAIVSTPSCVDGDSPTTDIVLNLADESEGAGGGVNADTLKVEEFDRDAGRVRPTALNRRLFVNAGARDLSVCLDCDQQGNAAAAPGLRHSPFPSVYLYWGSTFTN